MNAVNLLPARQQRAAHRSMSTSPAFLGLLGGLVMLLLATILFVTAHDRVSARQAELRNETLAAQRWSVAASRDAQYIELARQREKTVSDVRRLVSLRYDWSLLLTQIAALMPAKAQLSSLQATTPTAANGGSNTGIQVMACAASQPAVAQTMVALRRITGVARVTLSSSSSVSGNGGASCNLPVQFQITLLFATVGTDTVSMQGSSSVGVSQ